jgi:hypothetical protein
MKKTALIPLLALLASTATFAGDKTYEVTITNITAGQSFTPVLAVTHSIDVGIFELGMPASGALEMLAEGGMTMPLQDWFWSMPNEVYDTTTTEGLLGPGDSVTLEIKGSYRHARLSFAAMLLPTHDTFVAVDSMTLPHKFGATTAYAYDAGTEVNDETCVNIPGPVCMGEGYNEDGGEGFVHIANGIHGIGDLAPEVFDWRSAVAKVSVRRLK